MYQVGVDIGGTNIAMGLVDEALEVVQRESMPFEIKGGGERTAHRLEARHAFGCEEMIERLAVARVHADERHEYRHERHGEHDDERAHPIDRKDARAHEQRHDRSADR